MRQACYRISFDERVREKAAENLTQALFNTAVIRGHAQRGQIWPAAYEFPT